ncbi:MAG: type II secretion system F family protein [Planctomycetota bacterium]
MGHFSYKAVGHDGQHVAGSIEAPDRRSAVTALTDKGQFVTELLEQIQSVGTVDAFQTATQPQFKFGFRKIRGKDILAMTSQLSTALKAGLPLLNCLEIIRDQQHKPAMKQMMGELVAAVSSGQSLSEAMADHGDIFGPLYISMIRVGETGGIIEQTTEQLSQILSRDERVKTNMKNASAYPIFVLALGFISVIIVVTWILPTVLSTLVGGTEVLPLPTKILLAISKMSKTILTTIQGWFFLALIITGIYFLRRYFKTSGRLWWDSLKLKIPVLGSVLRTIAVGRFTRTLGALTKGGVTILEALGVVRDTLGNELLAEQIDEVTEKVKTGTSLASPLKSSGLFPPLLIQIVSVGEQTGKLDELLLNAAETFDGEADAAINRFIAIFPAVLIFLLALVIGFIIAATLLPIIMMQLGAGAM